MKAATPPSLVVLRTTAAGRAASSVTSKLSSKPQPAQADADSAFTPSSLPLSFPPPPSKKSARSPNDKQFKAKPTIPPNKSEWAIWKDTNASQLLASSPSSRAAGSEVAPATLSFTSTSSRSLKHAFSKIKQDSETKAVDSSPCSIHVKAVTRKAAAVLPEHPSSTTSNPGRPPLEFPPPALAVRRNKMKTTKKRATLASHRTSTPSPGVVEAAAQSIVPPIQDVGPDAWTRARETLQQVASLNFGAALQQRQQGQTPSSPLTGQQQDVAREMSKLIDTLAGLRDALSGQPSLASEARVEPTAVAFEASTAQQTPAEGVKKAKKMAKALKQAEEKTPSTSPLWREPLPSLSQPTSSSPSASIAPSPLPPATRDSTTGAWITSPHPPPGVTPPLEHLLTCPIAYWIGSAPYPPWSILVDRSRVLSKEDLARAALPFERLAVRPLSMTPPPLTPVAAGPWESSASAMAMTQARMMDLSREYEIEVEALMTMARQWQKAQLTREKHVAAAAAAPEAAIVSEPVVEETPVVVAEAAKAPAVTTDSGPDVEVKAIEMDPVIQAQPESLVASAPAPPPTVEEVAIVSPVVIKVEEPTVLAQEAVAIAPTPTLEPQAGEQGPIGGVIATLETSTDVAEEVPVSTSPVEAVVESPCEEVPAAVSATLAAPSFSTAPEKLPTTSSVVATPVAAPIKLRRSQRQKSPFTSSALGARPRPIPSDIPPPDEAPTAPKSTTYTISSSIPQEYESESRRTLASWGFDTGGVPSIETLVNRRRGVSAFKRSSVSSDSEDEGLGWPSSTTGFGVLQSGINGSGPGGSGATKGWGSVWSSLFKGRGMHDH